MKPAPLQLTDYFITALHLEANSDFDPEGEQGVSLDTIHVEQSVFHRSSEEKDSDYWQVTMKIRQEIPEGKNIPYSFELELQGRVIALPVLKGEILDRAVRANAPAMLFGAAREIIRAATGRGPYPAVVIPSTNFLALPPEKAAKKSAKKTSKKAAKKKALKEDKKQ